MNQRDLLKICLRMVDDGDASPDFVLRASELARTSDGVARIFELWAEADNAADRREAIEALGELLDDHEPAGPTRRVTTWADVHQDSQGRDELKARLRAWVERSGGVTQVARRAGMAQSALSRLLNTSSQPRPATLARLASGIGVTVAQLERAPDEPARRRGTGIRLEFERSSRAAPTVRYRRDRSEGVSA